MPFAGYDDWKDSLTYSANSVVYYKGYLYRAMTAIDAGDNPLTATHEFSFDSGDFGFDKIYPTPAEPNPSNTFTKVLRKWTVYDLPSGYYYQKLYGRTTAPGASESFANGDAMVLTVYSLGDSDQGGRFVNYNWIGYGLPPGLNSEWIEPNFIYAKDTDAEQNISSELIYHISFVPIDEGAMPKQYGDEDVTGFQYQSHLYQFTSSTFFESNKYGDDEIDGIRMWTMYYAAFSRDHNYTGIGYGSATRTSPAFADNYTASIPELPEPPETDPPAEPYIWFVTGINPNHPD
jgi:hypothetical protein